MRPAAMVLALVIAVAAPRAQTRFTYSSGQVVSPAYEGWRTEGDGSQTLVFGYMNQNWAEEFDIPVGPDNSIEPGGPDQGQPTHFEIGRQWGVFVVKVPKDFGTKAVTWTIVSNGETQSIPFTLNKGYPISPFKELGMGNQPPVLAFAERGAKVTGPPTAVSANFTGTVGEYTLDGTPVNPSLITGLGEGLTGIAIVPEVPEPSTLLLLGMGAISLFRRRGIVGRGRARGCRRSCTT